MTCQIDKARYVRIICISSLKTYIFILKTDLPRGNPKIMPAQDRPAVSHKYTPQHSSRTGWSVFSDCSEAQT